MHLEFELTYEDYRRGMAAHQAAAGKASRQRSPARNAVGAGMLLIAFGMFTLGIGARMLPMRGVVGQMVRQLQPLAIPIAVGMFLMTFFVLAGSAQDVPAERFPTQVKSGTGVGRGIFGWVLFSALAIMLFFTMTTQHRPRVSAQARPAPVNQSAPLQGLFIPLIPWLLILGFLWLVMYQRIKTRRRTWDRGGMNGLRQTWDVDENGVRMDNGVSRTESTWRAFVRWVQAPEVFLLYTSPLTFHLVPRRALASDADVEAFAELLRRHIQPPTQGFPVIAAPGEARAN